MQNIPEELLRVLKERLKLGDYAKPVCRVEVDRLIYVPGAVEHIQLDPKIPNTKKTVKQTVINNAGTITKTDTGDFSKMAFPVAGKDLSSLTDNYGAGRNHKGVDIGADVGTPVHSCWTGTVTKVVNASSQAYVSYGYHIEISHGNGISTLYGHLSQTFVEVGQHVTPDTVIAYVGNTGQVEDYRGPVTGSYSDPNSTRSLGWGAHLHFEVRKNGTPVNPVPYLQQSKKIYVSSTYSEELKSDNTWEGYPGRDVLIEYFMDRNWASRNSAYKLTSPFDQIAKVSYGFIDNDPSNYLVLDLNPETTPQADVYRFDMTVDLAMPGMFHMGFRSDFTAEDGELRVKILDYKNTETGYELNEASAKLQARITSFKGINTDDQLRDIGFPAGKHNIRIELEWKRNRPNKFAFNYLLVQELDIRPNAGDNVQTEPDKRAADPQKLSKIEDLLFHDTPATAELQVGKFVYLDTLVLDNVRRVEIDDQFEMQAREARLSISNPRGYYNPDYNPYYFPETAFETPWSIQINGTHVGVLSENTPLRIYLGYGMSPIRVFTGLIDKVDMIGEESMMYIYCRDMYKKIMNKVITEDKEYPDSKGQYNPNSKQTPWVKSAIVQDLAAHAGMYNWRVNPQDLYYPDARIEETAIYQVDPFKGSVIRPDPDFEGRFLEESPASILTPEGWSAPFVDMYRRFEPFRIKVSEAIAEVIENTNLRAYCDRYGTFRLEHVNYAKPIVTQFTEGDNLVAITKSIDWSRARSHVSVVDSAGQYAHFMDTQIYHELKGEVRVMRLYAPWANTYERKALAASAAFSDMKRICQTLQVSIPGDPSLDVMDRVYVSSSQTSTRQVYTIKGIRSTFDLEQGYMQLLDLMWSTGGSMM